MAGGGRAAGHPAEPTVDDQRRAPLSDRLARARVVSDSPGPWWPAERCQPRRCALLV